jgi:GH15 family glucan-1,4-alpha-glucosidase
MDRLSQSYKILDSLRLSNNMYIAAPSSDYSYVWLRDNVYIALAYLDKPCDTYQKTFHTILDIFKTFEQKIDYHIQKKPTEMWEYLHIRYDAKNLKEIDTPWNHAQNDAIGAMLYAIGEGEKRGKNIIRDNKDKEILQKIIWYLNTLEYWVSEDASMWEENNELRVSSLAACIAGLTSISDFVYVPSYMIHKGYKSLIELFPNESATRDVDLSLLSLIYPYNLLPKPMAQKIINNVERELLREKGVIRYKHDSYYSTLEKEFGRHQHKEFYDQSEAQWVFGLSFLSLAHMTIGDLDKGKYYIDKVESLMVEDCSLPELYFHGDYTDEKGNNYNKNCPLAWTQSMYVQSVEMYYKLTK